MSVKSNEGVVKFFKEQMEAKEGFISSEKEKVIISVRIDSMHLHMIDTLAGSLGISRSAFCSDLLISAIREILNGLEADGEEYLTFPNLLNEYFESRK